MSNPKIIFEEEAGSRRKKWIVAVGVIVAVLAASAYGLYRLARSEAGGDWSKILAEQSKLTTERESLSEAVERLSKENDSLRRQVAYLEQSQTIDSLACEEVGLSLAELQTQLAAAQKQVAFYRGIVSPEEARAGVRIRELSLRPTGNPGVFSFKMMLIQAMNHERNATGRATAQVVGLLDGAPHTLNWDTVNVAGAGNSGGPMRFDFKYFQELSGELALPTGFEPLRVKVKVDRSNRRSKPIEQSFEWANILSAAPAC